jgi:CRISPR-associated protein Cmr4
MKSLILGLLAETSIHPGAGQSAGFVDLPVAREAATDYPVIVGSSMKGALLDMARKQGLDDDIRKRIFGEQENAGNLLVSDARLLLLPVRSLKTQYKWVTCPHLIERLMRDLARQGDPSLKRSLNNAKLPAIVDDQQYHGADEGDLFLEERQFSRAASVDLPDELFNIIKRLIRNEATEKRVERQLVVISDNDFIWFARYGLSVNAHNKLDPDTKTVVGGGLWYEESIPPDALFYCLLAQRSDKPITGDDDTLRVTRKLFDARPYLQVGGNETVGQGWFAVNVVESQTANGGAV